ncbi:DeoR family transcriptional regulator [Flavivirga aquimarina]|uniref:DeoR family transcriptional regulator n=1 Tax=Flavivirga aquimarina TaxID=2027862 RepID=A0ABT8W907_9FLAO|nr:DeoR family transcriptional regulator [Flavivirga aquimarina]MDO5969619.1 DeoR family transcriptional regulator [Flavivirga aquimarina]
MERICYELSIAQILYKPVGKTFMKIPQINERTAQLLKLLNDDSDRVLNTKEVEARFNISSFTARADLKSLVELGFMDVIQVNKKLY